MTRHAISPLSRKNYRKGFCVWVIGDAPVGNKDLVKVWSVVGRTLEIVRLDTRMRSRLAPEDTEDLLPTRCREMPRNSGNNNELAACSGGSREIPRLRMSQQCLSST